MITFDLDQSLVPREHRLKKSVLARIGEELSKQVPTHPSGIMTLAFVTDEEIRRLNRMYRQKDKVTDVLSFGAGENGQQGLLGDVIIAFGQANRQAQAADGDLALELVDLVVHGGLHVLGYDHEKPEDAQEMFPLQDAIVAAVL